jgi:DNA repair exonuclease SbcCD ATPase subunit
LEIICINSYEKKTKEAGKHMPEIPPLPAEEAKEEEQIPPPPPPMEMGPPVAEKDKPPSPPVSLEQLRGKLKHVGPGAKEEERPGREDLLEQIKSSVGRPRGDRRRPIISLDEQIKNLKEKIARIRQEIQQLKSGAEIQAIQKKVADLNETIKSLELKKATFESEKVRNNIEITQISATATRKPESATRTQQLRNRNGELNTKINEISSQLTKEQTALAAIERTKPYSSIAAKEKSLLLLEQTLKDKQPQTDAPTKRLAGIRAAVQGPEVTAAGGLAAAVTRAQENPAFQAGQKTPEKSEAKKEEEKEEEEWPTN